MCKCQSHRQGHEWATLAQHLNTPAVTEASNLLGWLRCHTFNVLQQAT